jgi:chromosome segregation and condensation protein ScpB
MIKIETIRKKIIRRVEKASDSELDRISNYIDNLKEKEKRKKELLAYAGQWKDLPKELFEEFTTNLHKRRNSRRNVLS